MKKDSSKYNGPSPVVGISSLLTLFLILCLVVFACLSLASARSDYSFAQRNADSKIAYYNACNEAEEKISEEISAGHSGKKIWSINIDQSRTLEVEVEINNNSYKVNKWQTVVKSTSNDSEGSFNLLQFN